MRTYFWNCIIYNIDNAIPEIVLQQAYQKPVALGQSVNSNVAPVTWVSMRLYVEPEDSGLLLCEQSI
jgi:hypothetical protein